MIAPVTLVDGPHRYSHIAVRAPYGEMPGRIQVVEELYGRIGDTYCYRWLDPAEAARGQAPLSRLRGRSITLADLPTLQAQ